MKVKIGFSADKYEHEDTTPAHIAVPEEPKPVRSVVQIHFPARNMTLSYYNDQFNLHRGDLVFVDGKLEGKRGRVVDVAYNFKIKVSDYKRVIAVADTNVTGELHLAGSHFVAFEPTTMPYEKVMRCYLHSSSRMSKLYNLAGLITSQARFSIYLYLNICSFVFSRSHCSVVQ